MTEFNIGDKVKITGTDGSYTTYQVWADMVGSKRFTRGKYPSITGELEVISVAPHQSQNVTLYLLGGDEGEFIFDNSFGDIELVEKKPCTKVEYVKWNFECAWHAIKAFEDGEKLYTKRSHKDFILIDSAQDVLRFLYDLHERIETPMTWKEELYNYLDNSCEMSDDFDDSFTIEIEGRPLEFNLNDDEFVDMCKFVASLNSVN